jgi:N-methylhydantoinase A
MAAAEAIEIVNFQVTAVGEIPKPQLNRITAAEHQIRPTPIETRTAYFNMAEATKVPVFRRTALTSGAVIDGPAVIEEKTSTTVLYPGQRARIDGYLNIEIDGGLSATG